LPRQARRARAALDRAVTASQLTEHRQIHWRELATDDVAAGWQDLAGRARRSDSLSSQVRPARAALRGEANPHDIEAAQKCSVAQTDTREREAVPARAGPSRSKRRGPGTVPSAGELEMLGSGRVACVRFPLRRTSLSRIQPPGPAPAQAALLSRSAPLRPCQCPNQIVFLYGYKQIFASRTALALSSPVPPSCQTLHSTVELQIRAHDNDLAKDFVCTGMLRVCCQATNSCQ
jgi:hypothetical protein